MSETIGILVVDDEKEIADLLEIYLVNDGYEVYKAGMAMEGLRILRENKDIQLAIVDIMMPGMNGIEMCKKIREFSNIPIIILSAKSDDSDKVQGLGVGADDYMVKPFSPTELTARVKSQLRRYRSLMPDAAKNGQIISVSDVVIDSEKHQVTVGERNPQLTPIEFSILHLLASHPGRVFSMDEIYERVWNEKMFEANNTVMVHVRRLREKIEDDPRNPRFIKTVWGVGYKFEG